MHRLPRVRQPQREQEALGHLPGQAHPQIGEVDLGLRPGRVALRHEPGHHPRPGGVPRRRLARPSAGGGGARTSRRRSTTPARRAPPAAARRSAGRCGAACAAPPGPRPASHRSTRGPSRAPACAAAGSCAAAGPASPSPHAPCADAPRTSPPTPGSTSGCAASRTGSPRTTPPSTPSRPLCASGRTSNGRRQRSARTPGSTTQPNGVSPSDIPRGGANSECYARTTPSRRWGQNREEQWGQFRVLQPTLGRARAMLETCG